MRICVGFLVLLYSCGNVVQPIGDGGDATSVRPAEVCGGRQCASGEVCCFATSSCIAASLVSACRSQGGDGGSAGDASSRSRCFSNLDCLDSEYCFASMCSGPGECRSRSLLCNDESALCGCDGRNYPTICAAAAAGVRIAATSACGTPVEPSDAGTPLIGCVMGGGCPAGRSCCALTNTCIPESCRDCCALPPPGSVTTCRTNGDCPSEAYYCLATTCGGVGGCVVRPSSTNCAGVSEPVCGCDRRTYVNACLANAAGVAVAAAGMCM
jgi:hypothetical protein